MEDLELDFGTVAVVVVGVGILIPLVPSNSGFVGVVMDVVLSMSGTLDGSSGAVIVLFEETIIVVMVVNEEDVVMKVTD